ncbi:hypothetical protein C8J56DRAFT_815127 [Mycena floridula]|nr:hypothetical protein C8J56DRAFT_815127 [Mycena floridula]
MPVDHQNSSHSPYPTGSDHSSPASMVQYGERESSYDRNRSPQTFSPGRRPSIPQPVPIPNLTKKSRGRKVPVAPQADAAAVMGSEGTNAYGERRYLCTVEGCGKCFVRGEHLKRHIRSLHTNETPHLCPQIGCGKTFSRRDNLAQHAKVHL